MTKLTALARLVSVTLRDGLQSHPTFVPTAIKLELARKMAQAGLPYAELSSVVRPDIIPALKDWKEMIDGVKANSDAFKGHKFSMLILNQKGVEMGLKGGMKDVVDTCGLVISPCLEFVQKNMGGKSLESMNEAARGIAKSLKDEGFKTRIFVSTCFANPYTGEAIPTEIAAQYLQMAAEMGDVVAISDTTGHATKDSVAALIETAKLDPAKLALHMHKAKTPGENECDTAIFAMEKYGITEIDASLSSIGQGCPRAKNPGGNSDLFELVTKLEEKGHKTGVSLKGLYDSAKYLFANVEGLTPTAPYTKLQEMSEEERQKYFEQLQPYLFGKTPPQPQAQPLEGTKLSSTREASLQNQQSRFS